MSLTIQLLYTLAAASAAYVILKWWDNFTRLYNIPMPEGASRIWGHEWLEFEDDLGSQWKQWISRYGPNFKLQGAFGHHDILCVTDNKAIERILCKNTYNYTHSASLRPVIEHGTARGLTSLGEKDHRPIRAALAPAFTLDRVRKMSPNIWSSVKGVSTRLTAILESQGGVGELNMLDWTNNATLDIIGRVAFGYDFQQGSTADARLLMEGWRKQASLGMVWEGFVSLLMLRQFPSIGQLPLPAIKTQNDIRNTIKRLVNKRGINDADDGHNILSVLRHNNLSKEKEERISDDHLLDHIVDFVIAGHETTSAVLNLTLHSLAKDPEVQRKLREEIVSCDGEPSFDDLWAPNRFPYLDAVTREGFRLYPPSARSEKIAQENDILPLATPIVGTNGRLVHEIPIKAGQVIHIPTVAVNRLETVWGDGEEFRPERWIQKKDIPSATFLPGTWSSMLTFEVGPRSCLGYRIAVFEMKVLLMAFIRAFEFEAVADIETRMSATIQPRVVGRQEDGACMPLRVRLLA